MYLLADFLMIFILLRSLNPAGEEAEEVEEEAVPLPPLWLLSAVQWKADFRWVPVARAVAPAAVICPAAFHR